MLKNALSMFLLVLFLGATANAQTPKAQALAEKAKATAKFTECYNADQDIVTLNGQITDHPASGPEADDLKQQCSDEMALVQEFWSEDGMDYQLQLAAGNTYVTNGDNAPNQSLANAWYWAAKSAYGAAFDCVDSLFIDLDCSKDILQDILDQLNDL